MKSRVAGLSERYQQLKASSDEVQSRLRRAHDARQELQSVADVLTTWMDEVNVDDTPVTGLDAAALQKELTQTKVVTAELSVQKKMMDKLRAAAETLKSVGADDESLQVLVNTVSAKFARISDSAADRCNKLQVALVRSQGVHEGADGLLGWVRDAEVSLSSLVRPVRLDQESIAARITEAASLRADVESRAGSVDEVNRSAAAESDSPDVDAKLHDLNSRYERVATACRERESLLHGLSGQLTEFQQAIREFDSWLLPVFDVLDSRDVLTEPRLRAIADDIQSHESDVDSVQRLASEISNSPVVGDSNQVRDAVNEMERAMEDAHKALSARRQEGELRGQTSGRFEDLRQVVVAWLKEKEEETESFEPVAVDDQLLHAQMDQLKVCCFSMFSTLIIITHVDGSRMVRVCSSIFVFVCFSRHYLKNRRS